MRKSITHLTVALITFLLGSLPTHLSSHTKPKGSEVKIIVVESPATPPKLFRVEEEPRNLNPKESEIVSEAESFVCQNGYTEQQCGTAGRLYFEPGENPDHVVEIWARRHGTLESRAYGLVSERRGESTVWKVVFRYTERARKDSQKVGRVWVVEEGPSSGRYFVSFHRDFPLAKVTKKL